MEYPKPIQKLIDLFSKFPTVGPRTATRFVFYLMKAKKEKVSEIIAHAVKIGLGTLWKESVLETSQPALNESKVMSLKQPRNLI